MTVAIVIKMLALAAIFAPAALALSAVVLDPPEGRGDGTLHRNPD